MLGRLVQTTTSDGVRLHGFLTESRSVGNAWLFVHGVNSNFYSSSLLQDLAKRFAGESTAVLLVNTRGHDILSFNSGPTPIRTGAQVERLGASQLDLDAWIQLLGREGFSRVSILGHSLGALKTIMWSRKSHPILKEVVAVSPPRLNTNLLRDDLKRGPVFLEHLQEAAEKCQAGLPDEIMKVRFPLPMWISASAYLDKYGSGDKYDYLLMLEDVTVPMLWTFGQYEVEEGSANFKGANGALMSRIDSTNGDSRNHSVEVIAGADHSYRGVTSQLADCIEAWMDKRGPVSSSSASA